MRHWVANLVGLALGFTIGGEALFIYLAMHREAPAPPPVAVPNRPPVAPAPPKPIVVTRPPPMPQHQPVALPQVTLQPPTRTETLPRVIYPEPPSSISHEPGSAVAGTGFFVASDGSFITAAHVVSDCAHIRIVSRLVKPADADTLAIDTIEDIALLRAKHVTPPALLPIGRPAGPNGRLFVLGFPSSGNAITPTETWGVLENARLQPAPAQFVDPRRVIWAEAPQVEHGFSGGPMLDPRNGTVVGIVRGMVNSARLHAERASIPGSGMVIGPGSSPLAALLRQQGTAADANAMSGDEALDAARQATVHVLCLF